VTTGYRSATWLVKTGKNRDDVYVLEVLSGGIWKTSHHNDGGMWRIAMTRDGADQLGVERQVLLDWSRPEPQEGWSEGVGVLFPNRYFRPMASPPKNDVVQIPVTSEFNGIATRILFEEPNATPFLFQPAFPIAILARSNGGRVYVLGEPVIIEPQQFETFETMCAEARSSLSEAEIASSNRIVGIGRMDQIRIHIDLCVEPE
jgi:hypothetical protein